MRRLVRLAALMFFLIALGLSRSPAQVPMTGAGLPKPASGGGGCAGGTVTADASTFANSGASPATVSFTVGAGSNRALVIYVGQRTGALGAISATYNGASLTSLGTDGANGQILGLVNPSSGANNLVVTFAGGGTVSIGVLSVTGACQTGGATTFTNYTTGSNTSTLATVSVSSASGQMGFAGFIESNTQFTTPSGCNDVGHDGTGTNGEASCYQPSSGATVTLSYSTGSTFWIGSGISIKGN